MVVYKLNVFFILIINFMYIFRSFTVALRLENMIYLLTALMVMLNMIFLLASLKNLKVNCITVFIGVGLVVLLYSFLINPAIVGVIGFAVLFLNLLFWDLFMRNTQKEKLDSFFRLFLKVNVIFAVITALLGAYQYFVDPSLMGFAMHEVYGNTELMESGRFVRRATALMGSPQNYALYLGVMTSLLYYSSMKKKKRFLILIVLLMGGLVSGSRAYSLFIILTLLLAILLNGTVNIRSMSKVFKNIILFVFTTVGIFGVVNTNYSSMTFNRMMNFVSDWPALKIYLHHLKSLDLLAVWLGKGIGVNERIVVQFLGYRYYEIFGDYSNSYESYLLSVFMQMGVIGLIAYLGIYIRAIKNAYTMQNKLYFSTLMAIFANLLVTPSFNGLAMSYIIWPIILFPYYFKKEFINKSIKNSEIKSSCKFTVDIE